MFLPKLLELPFEGLPAGQIVLGGLAAVRTLEGRRRIGRDEIPGTLVTPTWERSVFVEPDQVERRSLTFCVLEQLRSALRRRDVFVSKSTQWGDPRAQLLGPDSWGKARTSSQGNDKESIDRLRKMWLESEQEHERHIAIV